MSPIECTDPPVHTYAEATRVVDAYLSIQGPNYTCRCWACGAPLEIGDWHQLAELSKLGILNVICERCAAEIPKAGERRIANLVACACAFVTVDRWAK